MTETMNWNKIVLGEKEVNIPPRFKWVAMDQDGCWFAFTSDLIFPMISFGGI